MMTRFRPVRSAKHSRMNSYNYTYTNFFTESFAASMLIGVCVYVLVFRYSLEVEIVRLDI